MTSIGSLIDPEVANRMKEIALLDPASPAKPIRNTDKAALEAIQDQRHIEALATIGRTQVPVGKPLDWTDPKFYTEETTVIDLNNVSDADLGNQVKRSIKTKKAKTMKVERKKAKAKQAKAEARDAKAIKKAQKGRTVLPGFVVDGSLTIEPLDTGAFGLDEAPSAIERRPYNQARFRLEGSPSLFPPLKDDGEIPENYVATTYQTLVDEHIRLAVLAQAKQAAKAAEPVKKAKKVVAVVDLDKKAKALAKITGVSKKQARKVLEGR